jgi:hypothetical protein
VITAQATTSSGASAARPGACPAAWWSAHYDHLGLAVPVAGAGRTNRTRGRRQRLPNRRGPGGGTELAARRGELARDVVFVAFSGEEAGILGSSAFTKQPPAGLKMGDVVAMLNMDMIGRLRSDKLAVLGSESALEWKDLVPDLCDRRGLDCSLSGDGYGPSDQTPFYAAGVPVLFFFTGAHDDYHKPADVAAKINAAGGVRSLARQSPPRVAASRRD